MYKCEYCDKEVKSKAGLVKHESSCIAKKNIEEIDTKFEHDNKEEEVNTVENEEATVVEETKPEVVNLEVVDYESTYYAGHPRRVIKLKGMLSKTFDKQEREKIYNLIKELQ